MLCRRHGFGGVLYRCLDRPALLIEDIELHGDCAGFFRIFSCQQTDAKVGFADASTRIDAWPQGEAEIGANRRPLETRSEEHTSELQSLMRISYAVFCLKKKNLHSQISRSDEHTSELLSILYIVDDVIIRKKNSNPSTRQ